MNCYWLNVSKENLDGLKALGFTPSTYCYESLNTPHLHRNKALKIVYERVYLIPCEEDQFNRQITLNSAASLRMFKDLGLNDDDIDKAMERLINDSLP